MTSEDDEPQRHPSTQLRIFDREHGGFFIFAWAGDDARAKQGLMKAHNHPRTGESDINNLTGRVIGAAIEVHRALGPGLLESAYEQCLCRIARRAGAVLPDRRLPIGPKENFPSVLSVSLWLDISGFYDGRGWMTLPAAAKGVELTKTDTELLKHETMFQTRMDGNAAVLARRFALTHVGARHAVPTGLPRRTRDTRSRQTSQ